MHVLQEYLAEQIAKRILSVKCMLFTINTLFLVWSIALVTIGAYVQQAIIDSYNLLGSYVLWPAPVAILFGVSHFCIALVGIKSILYRCPNLLHKYIIVLSIFLVVESAFLIAGFVMAPQAFKSVIFTLKSTESVYTKDHATFTTWNSVQQKFKCCGIDHYIEWLNYTDNLCIPDSCCVFYTADCGKVALKTLVFYRNGCGTELYRWALLQGIPIAVTVIISVLLKVIDIIFSWYYLRHLRDYAHNLNR